MNLNINGWKKCKKRKDKEKKKINHNHIYPFVPTIDLNNRPLSETKGSASQATKSTANHKTTF